MMIGMRSCKILVEQFLKKFQIPWIFVRLSGQISAQIMQKPCSLPQHSEDELFFNAYSVFQDSVAFLRYIPLLWFFLFGGSLALKGLLSAL